MSLTEQWGPDTRRIEVHGFKWPRRSQAIAPTYLLGEDEHGRWLGVAQGAPWRWLDDTRSGVFIAPLVKVVPHGTYWSACFQPIEPVVDVDIIMPVTWLGDVLEEVDLELDIQRSATGLVEVRDQDEFARVRASWPMPEALVAAAEAACARLQALVEQHSEPFGRVGHDWLARFMASPLAVYGAGPAGRPIDTEGSRG